MASIGNLVVKVSANTAAFRSDLKQAGKGVGGFRGAMGKLSTSMAGFAASMGPVGLALAALAAVAKATSKFKSLSAEIDSSAKSARLLAVELRQLEGLKFGGSLAGVDESKVIGGLKTMQKRLGEAARGSGAALPALDELGLNAEDLVGQDAIKSLIDIADAFDKIEEPAKRAAIASNIFSKGNMEMLLLVGQGGDAIRLMIAQMEGMSDVTSETAEEVEKWNDKVAQQAKQTGESWKSLGVTVAGGLNAMDDALGEGMVHLFKFFNSAEEGQKLDDALAKIAETTDNTADALSDIKAIDAFGEIVEDAETAAKSLEKMAESARAVGEALLGAMGGELDKLNDVDPIDAMLKQFVTKGLASDMSPEEFVEMAVKISLMRKELLKARAAKEDLAGVKMEELAEDAKHAADAEEVSRKASLGESLTAQFRTPLEEFVKVAEDLEDHLTSGVLVGESGEETARRAFAEAQTTLADSNIDDFGTTPDIFTGRAEAGSAEAIKTILRAQAGSSAVAPQEKLLLEGKKQTAHLGTLLGVVEKGVEKIDPPEVAEVNP